MTSVGSSTPTYDANGNATNDTAHTYTWDANGKPVAVDSVNLTYDALGRMVEQNKSGTYNQIVYTPTGGKLAIMSAAALQKAFVPLTGGSKAIYTSSGLVYYRHSDWIGSSRFASTPSRTLYYDGAYAPFGEAYAQTGTSDLSFTGMNQDTVANLYDFPSRELNNIQGRWPSPDPAGLKSVHLRDPQTWNRYVYARNSPLHITDPSGMYLGDAFGSQYDGDDGVVGATCYMCGGYTDPGSWGYSDQAFYGNLYTSTIMSNTGYGNTVLDSQGDYAVLVASANSQPNNPQSNTASNDCNVPYPCASNPDQPNSGSFMSELLGLLGVAADEPWIGVAGALISEASDPSPENTAINEALISTALIPGAGEAVGLIALGYSVGQWITNNVTAGILNAAPTKTITINGQDVNAPMFYEDNLCGNLGCPQ